MPEPLSDDDLAELLAVADGRQSLVGDRQAWLEAVVVRLIANLRDARAELARLTEFMDGVRDAARNRNPEGATVLDFFACWNEQYQRANDSLRADLAECREALAEQVAADGEPCRYDHNGFCQAHYSPRPCRIERARDLLTALHTSPAPPASGATSAAAPPAAEPGPG